MRFKNDGDKPLKVAVCRLDATVNWFPEAELLLAAGTEEDLPIMDEGTEFKVWVWVVDQDAGTEHEIAVVQLQRGRIYSLKDRDPLPDWQFMRFWGVNQHSQIRRRR